MSDPRQDIELHIGEATYLLRFTNSAIAHAEKLTGKTGPQLALLLLGGQFGFRELTALTCAGLEGARRKLRLGGKPWTYEQVAELLDDADDFDTVAVPLVDAYEAAMRRWFPPEEEPEGPPTAAGDGTTSSEPPSAPGSTATASGT
jgi:hypothetical protein